MHDDKYNIADFHRTALNVIRSEAKTNNELRTILEEGKISFPKESDKQQDPSTDGKTVEIIENLFSIFRSIKSNDASKIAQIELKICVQQLQEIENFLYEKNDLNEMKSIEKEMIQSDLREIIKCLNYFSRWYPTVENEGVKEANRYTKEAQKHLNHAFNISLTQNLAYYEKLTFKGQHLYEFRDFISKSVDQLYHRK